MGNPIVELTALRLKITGLKAVKCGMYHETVKRDEITGRPVTNAFPDAEFERVGFCSERLRAERIACAHSSSHFLLLKALNYLQTYDPDKEEEYLLWLDKYNRLTTTIFFIDHTKGDVEKEYAKLLDIAYSSEKETLQQVQEKEEKRVAIRQLKKQHNTCVEEIGMLSADILARLDPVITRLTNGSLTNLADADEKMAIKAFVASQPIFAPAQIGRERNK